jgi:hypothetical protein
VIIRDVITPVCQLTREHVAYTGVLRNVLSPGVIKVTGIVSCAVVFRPATLRNTVTVMKLPCQLMQLLISCVYFITVGLKLKLNMEVLSGSLV